MVFDGNMSSDSVRSAVCADWKDDRNWAARLPTQEEPLPPIHVGKEQEEIFAQTQQQIEKEGTLERRHQQQQGKLVPVAQLALTFGVLEACDADGELFATFPSSGHC